MIVVVASEAERDLVDGAIFYGQEANVDLGFAFISEFVAPIADKQPPRDRVIADHVGHVVVRRVHTAQIGGAHGPVGSGGVLDLNVVRHGSKPACHDVAALLLVGEIPLPAVEKQAQAPAAFLNQEKGHESLLQLVGAEKVRN